MKLFIKQKFCNHKWECIEKEVILRDRNGWETHNRSLLRCCSKCGKQERW